MDMILIIPVGAILAGILVRCVIYKRIGIVSSFFFGAALGFFINLIAFMSNDFSIGKATENNLYVMWLVIPLMLGGFLSIISFNAKIKRMENGDD